VKRSLPRAALIALVATGAAWLGTAPAGAVKVRTVAVNAPVVFGFTYLNGTVVESAALVEGRPFRRGGMELRGMYAPPDFEGRFTLFDGRGRLSGRAELSTADSVGFSGPLTVAGGGGRYARARGTLRFMGVLDTESVPGVTVLPGLLSGRLRVRPAAARPRFRKPVAIDIEGKGAKVSFLELSANPFAAKLTSANATAMDRFGKGVLVETDDVREGTSLRPKVVTWYGADGTWSARGTTNLDTGPTGSDPLKVTGGTGRYRGARGTLAYTALTEPSVNDLAVSRIRGRLRFPSRR
jgi:hypothetical protein